VLGLNCSHRFRAFVGCAVLSKSRIHSICERALSTTIKVRACRLSGFDGKGLSKGSLHLSFELNFSFIFCVSLASSVGGTSFFHRLVLDKHSPFPILLLLAFVSLDHIIRILLPSSVSKAFLVSACCCRTLYVRVSVTILISLDLLYV
jgi:hypothetical protein